MPSEWLVDSITKSKVIKPKARSRKDKNLLGKTITRSKLIAS